MTLSSDLFTRRAVAFLVAACMYVVAATPIHLVAPRLEPAQLDPVTPSLSGFPVVVRGVDRAGAGGARST